MSLRIRYFVDLFADDRPLHGGQFCDQFVGDRRRNIIFLHRYLQILRQRILFDLMDNFLSIEKMLAAFAEWHSTCIKNAVLARAESSQLVWALAIGSVFCQVFVGAFS